MIPKEAIEKAIEGGWHLDTPNIARFANDKGVQLYETDGLKTYVAMEAEIALDPSFLQALGKALGWEKETHAFVHGREDVTTIGGRTWLIRAFQFYEIVLTGGDTEKFWEELLGKRRAL